MGDPTPNNTDINATLRPEQAEKVRIERIANQAVGMARELWDLLVKQPGSDEAVNALYAELKRRPSTLTGGLMEFMRPALRESKEFYDQLH